MLHVLLVLVSLSGWLTQQSKACSGLILDYPPPPHTEKNGIPHFAHGCWVGTWSGAANCLRSKFLKFLTGLEQVSYQTSETDPSLHTPPCKSEAGLGVGDPPDTVPGLLLPSGITPRKRADPVPACCWGCGDSSSDPWSLPRAFHKICRLSQRIANN